MVSFQESIPHSPIYFDALSEMEEDAPLEERTSVRKEPTETSSPSRDPNKKAPMPLEQQEREVEEDALQHALHLSRVEAHRTRLAGSRQAQRIEVEKEAAGQPRRWTAGLTTRHTDGSKTHFPPPVTPRAYPGLGAQQLCPRI